MRNLRNLRNLRKLRRLRKWRSLQNLDLNVSFLVKETNCASRIRLSCLFFYLPQCAWGPLSRLRYLRYLRYLRKP